MSIKASSKIIIYGYMMIVLVSIFINNTNDFSNILVSWATTASKGTTATTTSPTTTTTSTSSNSKNNNIIGNIVVVMSAIINKIKSLKDALNANSNTSSGSSNSENIKKYKMKISILKDNENGSSIPLPFILIMASILILMIIIVASIIINHKKHNNVNSRISKLENSPHIPTKIAVDDINNIIPFSAPSSPMPTSSSSMPLSSLSIPSPSSTLTLPPPISISFRTPQTSPLKLISPNSEYKKQFQYISKLSDSIFELEKEKQSLTESLEQLSQESVTYKNDCENLTKMIKTLSEEKMKFQLLHKKETNYLNKLIERNRELLEDKRSFENNEQVLISTNQQLLQEKQLLEDKVINMEKQLEITESAKKKAIEELEEKNRLLGENKKSPITYDTELALRAELANLRSTKNALVTSIKSISVDELDNVNTELPSRGMSRKHGSKKSLSSWDGSTKSLLSINSNDDDDDDDYGCEGLSNLTEIVDIQSSNDVAKSEKVLKYISSQKKTRPAQHSFKSFYAYDKDDDEVSPRSLKSTSSKSLSAFESSTITNKVQEIQSKKNNQTVPVSDKIQSSDTLTSVASPPITSSSSLSPLFASPVNSTPTKSSTKSTPLPRSVKSAPLSIEGASGSKKKLNSDSMSSNTSVSSGSSSSSSKKQSSSSTKSRDTIKDRFIVPQSKLDFLLAPIQLPPTSSSYATNGYGKKK